MMQNPQVQYVSQPQQVVGTQQVVSAQPQTVIIQAPIQSNIYENYHSKQSKVLGAIQISTGILCVIFQIVAICMFSGLYVVGHGIWCGIFFILSGSFGVVAARSKTKCTIVTFMVLSILSAVLTMFLLGLGAAGWGIEDGNCERYRNYNYNYDYGYGYGYYLSCKRGGIAMSALMVFLALLEAVVAIWSSAICCAAICCGARRVQGQVLSVNAPVLQYGQPGQQIIYVTAPQPGVAYPQQPAQYQQVVTAGGYAIQPQQPPQAMGHQNAGMMMPPPYQQAPPSAPVAGGEQTKI